MNNNKKTSEKESYFFSIKKDDFSRISMNSNEMSTHSDVKETKSKSKIFKIQKYVKSGKFDNKILSEDEFSEEEILEKGELKKKISPYSKVNFSKLRNKEKTQRYLMMRKLVNRLNFRLKSLDKQVSKNPCSLLDKFAKIKISKLEKISNKPNRELNNEKIYDESHEFKFENLVKAAKKLYFYEDFEFSDEKNLLNLLFRLLDNEKTNLDSIHFSKIMYVLRIIKENNREENIIFQEEVNQKEPKTTLNQSQMLTKHSGQSGNFDLELNESNTEEEEYPLINLNIKVIDDNESFVSNSTSHQSMKIQITQKDLKILETSKEQNNILKIKFNLDDKKNFHFNQKRNDLERCELKLKNNFNAFNNKNKKIKSIGIKKNCNNKCLIEKNEDLICLSKLKSNNVNNNKKLKENINIKANDNEMNIKSTPINGNEEYSISNSDKLMIDQEERKEKNFPQSNETNDDYPLHSNDININNESFDIKCHLLNILNQNILKTNKNENNCFKYQLNQEHLQTYKCQEKDLISLNHFEFMYKNPSCLNQYNFENYYNNSFFNDNLYNFYLNYYLSNQNNNNQFNHTKTILRDENSNNILLNNKTLRETYNKGANNLNNCYPYENHYNIKANSNFGTNNFHKIENCYTYCLDDLLITSQENNLNKFNDHKNNYYCDGFIHQ